MVDNLRTDARAVAVPSRAVTRRRFLELIGLAGSAGLGLGACAGHTSASGTSVPGNLPSFPIGAAASSARKNGKPVEITLWHSMSNANLTTLQGLAHRFNSDQKDVFVNLVNQTSYPDTMTLYTAALGGGTLPDLVQIESIDLQLMIDSQSIVPVAAAVAADRFDLSGFLGSTIEYFRVDGVLYAMPFNISTQVLYYDKKALARAGLDPTAPLLSFEELRTASERIVRSKVTKYGMSLKLTASNFEEWIAMGGGEFVNRGNGRAARATAVSFGGSLGRSIFGWFASMVATNLAQATSGTAFDNLTAIPDHIAPITTDTSAALGTVVLVLGSGQYPDVELGIAPMPGPPGPGGVPIGGAGLYIVKASPPERQDAAWQFAKFLVSTASQATWAAGTGYVPVVTAATTTPVLVSAWSQVPGYRVAYEQLRDSPVSVATAGGVSGAYAQIETAVVNGLTAIANGTPPGTALAETVTASNDAIGSYNARIGA